MCIRSKRTRSPRGQHGGCKEELGCSGCWTQKAQSVRTRKVPLWRHHHLEVSFCLGKLYQDCPGQSALPQVSWSLRAGHQVLWPVPPSAGPGWVVAAHSSGGSRPLPSFWESSEGRKWSYHSGMTVGATGVLILQTDATLGACSTGPILLIPSPVSSSGSR